MAGQADGNRAHYAVRYERGTPDHDHDGGIWVSSACFLRCGEQFLGDQPLAPLEAPAPVVAIQLLGCHGAKFLLNVIEVPLHFANGTWRQRRHAGHVRDIDDLYAARPSLQQPDCGVERPAGGRGSVIADHKSQVWGGRRVNSHRLRIALKTGS